MTVLIDTSALLALLDSIDRYHARASRWYASSESDIDLVTHNYVVTEAMSLAHARYGSQAVGRLVHDLIGPMAIVWVTRETHASAAALVIAGGRKRPSFVDQVSFEVMRDAGIETAFAFDRDFKANGFNTVP